MAEALVVPPPDEIRRQIDTHRQAITHLKRLLQLSNSAQKLKELAAQAPPPAPGQRQVARG